MSIMRTGVLLLLASVAVACTAPATRVEPAEAPLGLPADLEPRLVRLDSAQREFLLGEDVLRVVPTRGRLIRELGRRDAEQVEVYVGDLMAVVAAMRFDPERDMAEVPMNLESPDYNSFRVLRPVALEEHRREPGPFMLSRYLRGRSSIPTFAGAPVAITPEDLVAGDVDVAIVGIPQNLGSGWRDARNGPRAMRAMHGLGDRDMYSMLDPHAELNIVDYGDFAVDRLAIERTTDHIRVMVREVAETGTIPMLVGGDMSLTFSTVAAISDLHGRDSLTLVHFGAHYNADRLGDHPLTDRQSIHRLLVSGLLRGSNVIQVGLRGPEAGPEDLRWLREQGVRYHTMASVERQGWPAVMERVLAEAKAGGGKVYVAVDLSVLEPGIATAGRPVPGGLVMRELLPAVRRLCAETEVVGFELMDLAPMLDPSIMGALAANYVMNACLAGVALRKRGMTEPGYLHPLVVDHGS